MPPLPQLTSFAPAAKGAPPTATVADVLPCAADARFAPPRGVYVHVPFCFHKCHYCDFYSFVDSRGQQPAFVARLEAEIDAAASYLGGTLDTIFIGGGTPTLLGPGAWRGLLARLTTTLPWRAGGEITIEANPETLSAELADTLAAGGVNRISIGAQSFDPRLLRALERHHDPASVERSVTIARRAGIGDVNLDLIFGIPGQSVDGFRADLDAALDLKPTHLSCYGLMYEPNTPLTKKLHAGLVNRVDEDDEAAMYELALDRLEQAGFTRYEVSNWARPGHECRHNLLYWRNESWWPLGPSAAGHATGVRWKNVPHLGEYLAVSPLPPITDVERLDGDGRAGEILMLGLRLTEGVPIDRLEELLNPGRRAAIARHRDNGLLEQSGGRLRLTRRGLLLADSVIADVL